MKKLQVRAMFLGIALILVNLIACDEEDLALFQSVNKLVTKDSTANFPVKPDSVIIANNGGNKDSVIIAPVVPPVVTPAPDAKNAIYVENPGENNDIQPNFLKAYNKAVDGEVIVLPAGNFMFRGSVTIRKMISIRGAGMTKTILYRDNSISDKPGYNSFFNYDINSDDPSNIVVSNLYLKSKDPNSSTWGDFGIVMNKAVDFVITGCRFENFGFAAIRVNHKDQLARGLIYLNQFYHNFKSDGMGLGYGVVIYGADLEWNPSINFGSDNFIFIEENTFDYHRHSVAAGGAGMYVFRYNKITNNWIDAAIDMHEARNSTLGSGNHFATRAAEIYNNDINASKFGNNASKGQDITSGHSSSDLFAVAISPRGGDALVYNNKIAGTQYAMHCAAYPKYFSDSKYPVSYGLGYNSALNGSTNSSPSGNSGDGDGFFWDNQLINYQGYTPKAFSNWSTAWFQEGRDFHLVAKPGYRQYTYPHPKRQK